MHTSQPSREIASTPTIPRSSGKISQNLIFKCYMYLRERIAPRLDLLYIIALLYMVYASVRLHDCTMTYVQLQAYATLQYKGVSARVLPLHKFRTGLRKTSDVFASFPHTCCMIHYFGGNSTCLSLQFVVTREGARSVFVCFSSSDTVTVYSS